MNKLAALQLENQLCFPLYACAREVVRLYTPALTELGLTYTQYIVLLVLWERDGLTVKELGARLFLDTGTLTPLLKKLEQKKLLTRKRDPDDERNVRITLRPEGLALRERALAVPQRVGDCLPLEPEEAQTMYRLLYKTIHGLKEKGNECL